MDFGSSHVYAGDESAIYYSSVPTEKSIRKHTSSNKSEHVYDPVYESIGDVTKNLNGQSHNGARKENEYDIVTDDQSKQVSAWDEVSSNKPPPIPMKPAIYSTQSRKHNDEPSLAEQLRRALEEREKTKTEVSNTQTSAPLPASAPPKKPPRKKRSKAVVRAPVPIRRAPPPPPADHDSKTTSYEEVKLDISPLPNQVGAYEEVDHPPPRSASYEEVKLDKPSKSTPDPASNSLIDFSSDCIIPAIAPPPTITKSVKVLPNVPYNPFDDVISSNDAILDPPLLQPTLMKASQENLKSLNGTKDRFMSNEFPSNSRNDTETKKPSNFEVGLAMHQQTSVFDLGQTHNDFTKFQSTEDAFSDLHLTNSKELTNLYDFSERIVDGLLDSNKPRQSVIPNHYVASENRNDMNSENSVNNNSKTFDAFSPNNPFVSNPLVVSECPSPSTLSSNLLTNGFTEPSLIPSSPKLIPTAPALTNSMVRKDAEFLENQLKNAQEIDAFPSNGSAGDVDVTALEPSAPSRTPSMLQRDQHRKIERSSSRASSNDPTYSTANTNVVCIKLGIVADNQASFVTMSVPSQCASCRGINYSNSEKWECVFCTAINKTHAQAIPDSSSSDVTYVLQSPINMVSTPESLIVFCVDTSGSMCVTSEVNASGNKYFLSRLKALQLAITDQLNVIEAKRPNTRIALVTFNDYVHLIGDGSSEKLSLSEYQLFDFDYLTHVGTVAPMPGLIRDTKVNLTKAVFGLNANGGTALGPALLLSTALAAKLPGSQVIVCTDGRANVGVGSLESESDYSMCHHFYDQATAMAATYGVIVNVLAIAGTDCRLVQLGKIADKTAGKVNVVENTDISKEFLNILSDSVLATNVSIDLITHRQLYFKHKAEIMGSNVSQFVGNITNDSEVTFQYGVRADEEFATLAPPHDAPFQLKILYRTPDGGVYLRVLTQVRPVTENKELAETDMNPAVIGAFAAQYAARLALEGDLDHAKEVTNAHKDLVSRGMSLKSHYGTIANEESIYECVRKKMDDIGSELSKADTASTCSSDRDPTYHDPDLLEEEEDDTETSTAPPTLPPRRQNSKPEHHGSVSSIQAKLAKLPSIPKGPIGKKKKRNKKKTAMQYKDKTAVNMFKNLKASSASFS